ncbi:MAG: ketoacyl-ACP synthase III [Anaplasmataceae bacterium]|nr:ketoacyl-ACP synthase III [Anaplasmataceae bacterium]
MKRCSAITAIGGYLPKKIVTNDDLAKLIDTNDQWIRQRTGIKSRHIAGNEENTLNLSINATNDLISNYNIDPLSIDLIIVATCTADKIMPSTAVLLQHAIGAKNAFGFDVQAACSGFLYALDIADSYLKSGKINNILIVGVDKMSSIVDWSDRNTCILFGDGAGVVLLSSQEVNEKENNGMLDTLLSSDGGCAEYLQTNGGITNRDNNFYISMNGKVVFENAIKKMSSSLKEILLRNNLTVNDIDFFVPHQANTRIIEGVANRIGLSNDKIINTVECHGNTSAASIPLAMWLNRNKLQGLIAISSIGAGLVWGSCLIYFKGFTNI